MRDTTVDRQTVYEELEPALAIATKLRQYVLAYLIEHAIAEAWTSAFPNIEQLLVARVNVGTPPRNLAVAPRSVLRVG